VIGEVPTLGQQLAQLAEQQAAITQALLAMDEGRWTGDGSVEAYVLALNPTWNGELVPKPPLYVKPPVSVPPLHVQWIGSPNYWSGHGGMAVVALVLHTMGGTLAGCDSWFGSPESQVSSHYGIGLDGAQHQYVHLADSAWANGVLELGNEWQAIVGNTANPNWQTISIETADDGSGATAVTDAQYSSTLAVARHALDTYPTIRYLFSHQVISPQSRPQCCGDRWWGISERFADLAQALGLEGYA
jgi:N-acetylmuramoyl-L-alanine amidase-like protein